jgi:putative inorganic carbon (hco3(-)) transporter
MFNKQQFNKILDFIIQYSILPYLFFIPFEHHSTAAMTISLCTTITLLVIKYLLNKDLKIEYTYMALPFILFFLWSLSSTIWSILPGITFKYAKREILYYIALFYAVRLSLDNTTKQERAIKTFFYSSLFIQIYGIITFLNGSGKFNGRLIATFTHPNIFGLFAATSISFSMSFLIVKSKNYTTKILPFLVLITGISSLIFSSSRTSIMGLSIAFFMIALFKEKKLLIVFLIIIALIVSLTPLQRSDLILFRLSDLNNLLNIDKNPLGERFYMWYSAMTIIKDHPLLGIGYGKVFEEEYVTRMLPRAKEIQSHSHNIILETALETGFVGLFLFFWLHFVLILYLVKAFKNARSEFRNKFLLGYTLFFISFFINGLVEFNSRNRLGLLFWFFTAIMVGLTKIDQKAE